MTLHSTVSTRPGCEFAILAVLSVLIILIFPVGHGPYSVTHGPVTVFQAVRAAARVQTAIVHGALNSLGNSPTIILLVVVSRLVLSDAEFQVASFPQGDTILRC